MLDLKIEEHGFLLRSFVQDNMFSKRGRFVGRSARDFVCDGLRFVVTRHDSRKALGFRAGGCVCCVSSSAVARRWSRVLAWQVLASSSMAA
jgi:hypothetical protein